MPLKGYSSNDIAPRFDESFAPFAIKAPLRDSVNTRMDYQKMQPQTYPKLHVPTSIYDELQDASLKVV